MTSHLLVVAFVWGLTAFAVAIDASRRGRHGGLWAVLTFVTGAFGAVLYVLLLLFTDDPSDGGQADGAGSGTVRVCPDCATRHDDAAARCGECGAELGPEADAPVGQRLKAGAEWYCSNCKSEIGRETGVCPDCGAVF